MNLHHNVDPEVETAEMAAMSMYDHHDITHPHDEVRTRLMVRVPGGWVYEVQTGIGMSTCFIPHPEGKV